MNEYFQIEINRMKFNSILNKNKVDRIFFIDTGLLFNHFIIRDLESLNVPLPAPLNYKIIK